MATNGKSGDNRRHGAVKERSQSKKSKNWNLDQKEFWKWAIYGWKNI